MTGVTDENDQSKRIEEDKGAASPGKSRYEAGKKACRSGTDPVDSGDQHRLILSGL